MDASLDATLILNQALNQQYFGVSIATFGRYTLLIIMFNMGLALRVQDFTYLATNPRAVAVGLSGQIIVPPAVALALLMFSPPPELAVGLILLACCPGAATSNFFSYLARGDIALSVVLTALSGFVVLFTMPLLVNTGLQFVTGAGYDITLPVWRTMREILIAVVLPVALGMWIRAYLPERFTTPLRVIATRISFAFLIVLVILTFGGIFDELPRLLMQYGAYAFAMNIAAMVIGYLMGRAGGLTVRQRRTVTLEIGVQNFLVGMTLALNVLHQPVFVVFPLIYVFAMYVTAFSYIGWCHLRPVPATQ